LFPNEGYRVRHAGSAYDGSSSAGMPFTTGTDGIPFPDYGGDTTFDVAPDMPLDLCKPRQSRPPSSPPEWFPPLSTKHETKASHG